ncbi:transposase [bacterium]|nr:transposase [bacterium]
MGNNRTKYDSEFKINIVKMVLLGSKTMREIAKDMGVDYSTLSK